MDFQSSDSEEFDENMLILCSDLNIRVPANTRQAIPITLTDLENIDINNLPIEIVSEPPSPSSLDLLNPQNVQDNIHLSSFEQVAAMA